MHKGYTLSYFIDQVKATNAKKLSTENVYSTLSPRNGFSSSKSAALDNFLNGHTTAITSGVGFFSTYGKTARTRLLKALKLRKATGSVFGNN